MGWAGVGREGQGGEGRGREGKEGASLCCAVLYNLRMTRVLAHCMDVSSSHVAVPGSTVHGLFLVQVVQVSVPRGTAGWCMQLWKVDW